MTYLEPIFNKKGQPICAICAVAYDKLLLHVNKRHGLAAKEYKMKFRHHPRKGIQSLKLQKTMRKSVLANYDKVVMQNLIIGGQKTRFRMGNSATNKELVSSMAKARMKAYWVQKRESKEQLISRLTRTLNASKQSVRHV